jgi:hypothetical protein
MSQLSFGLSIKLLDLIRPSMLPKANIDGNCAASDILSRGKNQHKKDCIPEV